MKIVLTGGGTAGHVMPHIALMSDFEKYFDEIFYIGSESGIEKKLMEQFKEVKYFSVTTVKFVRGFNLKNLLIPFKLLRGIHECKNLLKEIRPNVVFSKGGFVSVPVCIAAKKLKIPVVSHESDFSLGLANKIIYRYANVMCCSFEETCKGHEKCIFTGSAIRKKLLEGSKAKCQAEFNLNPSLPTIVVTGGSLGAQSLNEKIWQCQSELLKDFNIIHLCGKGKINESASNIKGNGKYIQIEFAPNPENIYACADIVVCRAGSNTIFEFLALEKPMLLVPLSNSASRGDQVLNSKYFKKHGLAEFVLEENLSKQTFLDEIRKINNNKTKIKENIKNSKFTLGNERILRQILKNLKK